MVILLMMELINTTATTTAAATTAVDEATAPATRDARFFARLCSGLATVAVVRATVVAVRKTVVLRTSWASDLIIDHLPMSRRTNRNKKLMLKPQVKHICSIKNVVYFYR